MKYEPIDPLSKEDAEEIFSKPDDDKIAKALLQLAYYDTDWRWVQSKCLHYIEIGGLDLQSTAILCLGHLARIHRQLDLDQVLPALRARKDDKNLRGRVNDVLEDIDIYITVK